MGDKLKMVCTSLVLLSLAGLSQAKVESQSYQALSGPPGAPGAPMYRGYASNIRNSYGTYMSTHPTIHNAVKDGAWGAALGAAAGLISRRGIVHGAMMGAGTGAGVGALRSSKFHWQHPLATNVASAGLSGLGLYLAVHHGHGLL